MDEWFYKLIVIILLVISIACVAWMALYFLAPLFFANTPIEELPTWVILMYGKNIWLR